MKFNTAKLLAFTEQAIAEKKARSERLTAEATDKWLQNRSTYAAETAEAWRALVKQINLVLRSDRAMTADDIPAELRSRSGWSATLRVFDSKPPTPYSADTRELERIAAVLRATDDIEVTAAGLARVGVKLGPVFAAQAAEALRKA